LHKKFPQKITISVTNLGIVLDLSKLQQRQWRFWGKSCFKERRNINKKNSFKCIFS